MNRREFTKFSALLPILANLPSFAKPNKRAPSLFIGHGTPLNVLMDTPFTKEWDKLSKTLEKPAAIIMVSAHWQTNDLKISTNDKPETIYDFYGFPDFMYNLEYKAKGNSKLATSISELNLSQKILTDEDQGLDHGAWCVLYRLFPKADVPVFQLSLSVKMSLQEHYRLAQELRFLRDKNIMIIGSGNITHNLYMAGQDSRKGTREIVHEWARVFDEIVESKINSQNYKELINYHQYGLAAKLSVPTPEHYLPLLYTLGTAFEDEKAQYYAKGFDPGSFSMRSVLFDS